MSAVTGLVGLGLTLGSAVGGGIALHEWDLKWDQYYSHEDCGTQHNVVPAGYCDHIDVGTQITQHQEDAARIYGLLATAGIVGSIVGGAVTFYLVDGSPDITIDRRNKEINKLPDQPEVPVEPVTPLETQQQS